MVAPASDAVVIDSGGMAGAIVIDSACVAVLVGVLLSAT
jgi:hypothetical protein